jgi:carboxyl-terminal processing protease
MRALSMKILLCLFLPCILFADPLPVCEQLKPADVVSKTHEILDAHCSFKKLTPKLVERALSNYLDALDPAKTYLVREEIEIYLNPPIEMSEEVLKQFLSGDFSQFAEIYGLMEEAIKRRELIEGEIVSLETPLDVKPNEFKDPDWATNIDDLKSRLLRLRALQYRVAARLGTEDPEKIFDRVNKRRHSREQQISGLTDLKREEQILFHVLKATASALDAQTTYFTPQEAQDFLIQVQQRLYGIGVQLRDSLNGFTVVRLVEGGPAWTQGDLRANDLIVAVNDEPVVGMDITDFVRLVRGEAGSEVSLTVLRETGKGDEKQEERLDISVVRGEVVFKETRIESECQPFGDGVIGCISLYSFYQDERFSSALDLAEEIDKLEEQHNLKGLILDLRHNAGGLLPQAIDVAGLFITKGIVAAIKSSRGEIQYLRDLDPTVAWNGPLIILTSRLSASAAEIVAQSLQDYGRAVVVGDPESFGKGTYQTSTLDLMGTNGPGGTGEYKVTRGTYYTVSGKSPQLVGVLADIPVPGPFSQMEIGEQHSKFPIDNDRIAANFHDDLSDVPLLHRASVRKEYHFDLQPRLSKWSRYVKQLSENSADRIKKSVNYQAFIQQLGEEDWADSEPAFGKSDLQLEEAYQIMKDMIYLDQLHTTQRPGLAA